MNEVTFPPPSGTLPLAGLRIVELSTFVAAPLAGMTLAQLGADVIRIDSLKGSSDRQRLPLAPSGESLYWAGLNKGKRSITLNLHSTEGKQLAIALATAPGVDGGVFVTNAVRRPWLDYEVLRRRRDDVIRIGVLGYPNGGPAVDYTVNARLGFPFITGPRDHTNPVNHVLPAWDVATGLHVALAVLAADRQRRLTGRGASISVSMWDVALALTADLGITADAELNDTDRSRDGNFVFGTFGVDFSTVEHGWVMVVTLTSRHWRDLVTICGVADVIERLARSLGADFDLEGHRYRHRDELAAVFRPWFASRTLAEITRVFADASFPWAPYGRFKDLLGGRDQLTTSSGMMRLVNQPGIGPMTVPGSPLDFSGTGHPPPSPAPALGQHTAEILAGILQMPDRELRRLIRSGVIGPVNEQLVTHAGGEGDE
jgi:2-methylfumaryl-CoA isomerase